MNRSEPSAGKKLTKPAYLGRFGSKMWDKMVKTLGDMGVLDKADENSIMLWCLRYEDLRAAREFCKSNGSTFEVVDQSGNVVPRVHPMAKIAGQAWKDMRSMIGEFGFTPSSRVRLGSMKEPEDELDALMAEFRAKN